MIQACHSISRFSLFCPTSSPASADDFTRVYSLDVRLFDNFHFPYFHAYNLDKAGKESTLKMKNVRPREATALDLAVSQDYLKGSG